MRNGGCWKAWSRGHRAWSSIECNFYNSLLTTHNSQLPAPLKGPNAPSQPHTINHQPSTINHQLFKYYDYIRTFLRQPAPTGAECTGQPPGPAAVGGKQATVRAHTEAHAIFTTRGSAYQLRGSHTAPPAPPRPLPHAG